VTLSVDGARVVLQGTTVLDGVDLRVGRSEIVVVLGPSGCGKTTLLRAIAGLQPLDGGRVSWDGTDLAGVASHERHFGLMFQEYALFPHRDVAGNVEFGLRMAGVAREARANRVDEVLRLVGLVGLRDRRVAGLSGGEQQRVALARALAVSPRLLMLDEPLGALDREWREKLLAELRTIVEDAALPTLYVTHDHDEAFALATRLVVMRQGRIVQEGDPESVWRRPVDAQVATFLGFGPALDVEVDNGVVHTPWGALVLASRAERGPTTLVLRPDALRVAADGAIAGKVTRATFAGDRAVLVVDAGGPPLRVTTGPDAAPVVGDVVHLAVERDAVLLYPRDSADAVEDPEESRRGRGGARRE
jgi:thiamine transport system ATP-binding protein